MNNATKAITWNETPGTHAPVYVSNCGDFTIFKCASGEWAVYWADENSETHKVAAAPNLDSAQYAAQSFRNMSR